MFHFAAELIVGNASDGSAVQVFTDADFDRVYSDLPPIETFNAFAPAFTGGVYVAAGAVAGAGGAGDEIFIGAAKNARSVKIFTDSNADGLVGNNPAFETFLAFPTNIAGGVRVAAGNTDPLDGEVELLAAARKGSVSTLKVFDDDADAGSLIGNNPLDDQRQVFAASVKNETSASLPRQLAFADANVRQKGTTPAPRKRG